ncbi:hypothetical protein OU5_3319 [Pseudomonas mandelii JR-1]|uniref:Uncharacterized protein n=1 Tax=Pseudomonas mandelii JR-1 TaxID=1147786 RepID=A0A024EDI6_9PSED|nr:hypothetical protein OU5_3319 [Pseudomonas mandelii JR-1]
MVVWEFVFAGKPRSYKVVRWRKPVGARLAREGVSTANVEG